MKASKKGMDMTNRQANVQRKTTETVITIALNLDGEGDGRISTGIGFFDHMLHHVARHGLMDMTVSAKGDTFIDDHHTIEDVGIAFGQAIRQALGDCEGITRYGDAIIPMDEALVLCALDISGRGLCYYELSPSAEKVGEMTSEMAPEFFRAVAYNAGVTLHLRQLSGVNSHHILEAAFKAFGRALAMAVERSERVKGVPSTKGVI